GLVAAASVAAYDMDRIRKHEFTRPDKENDRTVLADTLDAHTGPVFLTYRQSARVDALVEQIMADAPACDFVAPDGVSHSLWVVADLAIQTELTAAVESLPRLYVADGHHRSAAASRVCAQRRAAHPGFTGQEPFNRFLAVLFPDNQVRILDYNRVVRDLNGYTSAQFLSALEKNFLITRQDAPCQPRCPHTFGLYLERQWYALELRPGRITTEDPVARLDVQLLSTLVLEPLLNITDLRRDTRIDFVGGIRGMTGLMERVHADGMAAAFSLYPTSLRELMAVADAGRVMPPKSTWFEPKLRDGLVIQTLSSR
ncbi:MAG: DUF1015 family protein, partial [Magnetococcus sp. WYHC-3]